MESEFYYKNCCNDETGIFQDLNCILQLYVAQVYPVSIQQSLTLKHAPRGAATIQTIFFTQHGFHLRYSVTVENFDWFWQICEALY